MRFEDAGVRRFFEETLGAMSPSDAPAPYMWAMWGHVYINADQLANLGSVMPGSSRQSIYQQYMACARTRRSSPPAASLGARVGSLRSAGPVAGGMLRAAGTAKVRFDRQAADIRGCRPATATPDELDCLRWVIALESLTTGAWRA